MTTVNPATLMSGRFTPDEIPDQTGRVVIVTGGSAGIGYYTALPLAEKGAKVYIISSSEDHGETAAEEMNRHILEKHSQSGGKVEWIGCDFRGTKEVDQLSKRLANELPRLDLLILNAGIGVAPYEMTKSGLPNHFAINNLAHYVMALRLLPAMEKTVSSGKAKPLTTRIVLQSSEMHRLSFPNTKFANKEEIMDGPDRDPSHLYSRTKLGLIFLGQQLAKRKLNPPGGSPSVLVMSVHPGTVDTAMQAGWKESYGFLGSLAGKVMSLVGKNAPEGAEAGLWAAASPEMNESNWRDYQGKYFSEAKGKKDTENDNAKDEEASNNFWNLCSELAKEQIGEELR